MSHFSDHGGGAVLPRMSRGSPGGEPVSEPLYNGTAHNHTSGSVTDVRCTAVQDTVRVFVHQSDIHVHVCVHTVSEK